MTGRAGHDDSSPPVRRGLLALAVLFLARIAVSFQFQSVAPLSPLLEARFPVALSGLGLLLGIYMAPGIVVALGLPGLVGRFGRARLICLSLLLMAAGEVLLWSAGGFGTALLARLLGGAGGCVIYIITINMVADLDTGVSPAARMGVIAAAWPFGNAFALGLLGWLVQAEPALARNAPLALALAGLAAIVFLFALGGLHATPAAPPPSLAKWKLVIGRIWPMALSFSLYNIGFIILTGFAGRILVEDGVDASVTSGIAGIPMWMFLLSVPLGGFVSGRSVAADRGIVAFGCLVAAVAVLASAGGSHHWPLYLVAGLVGGLPTAPMLARGRNATGADTDITYSALFFVFFATLIVLPPLAGAAADLTGSGHTVLAVVALLLLLATFLFGYALRRLPGHASI